MPNNIDRGHLRKWMNDMCESRAEAATLVITAMGDQPVEVREEFLRLMEHDIKRLALMHRIAVQRLSPRTNNNRMDNATARRRSFEMLRRAKFQVRTLGNLA